ncbi:Protein of unknown function [Gryllus bimaculatus]|nr:Protein of unknown function [Gryllus bimaculatus]
MGTRMGGDVAWNGERTEKGMCEGVGAGFMTVGVGASQVRRKGLCLENKDFDLQECSRSDSMPPPPSKSAR